MTVLTPKKSFESKESVLIVDELPVGTHVIRLVVVDDEDNSSDPFDVTVEVTQKGTTFPIGSLPPRVITTVPNPGDPVIRTPLVNRPGLRAVQPLSTDALESIDVAAAAETLKATPVAKTTKTVKVPPVKPTNIKPGDKT